MKNSEHRTSPKDFFLHLLAMVALYASAISFIVAIFQIVNIWLPDPLNTYVDGARNMLRTALSFLIVLFPVYVATVWNLYKTYEKDTAKKNLAVRKWLLYFTEFVAALILIFTTVALVNTFLQGDLTGRFFLKLLSIFFTAGAIFGYYRWELKRYQIEKAN